MERVAPGVWRAGTRYVNWYVLDGGAVGLTIVDAGFPGYANHLDRSLQLLGRRREDVRAVLLTHGHIDHLGMAATLAGAGATVHLHAADASLAARPKTNQPEKVLPYLMFPATVAFLAHAVRSGATSPEPLPASVPLMDGSVVDVPGRPLVRHTPGHTDGSCILDFRDHWAVLVGDRLCTIEPRLGRLDQPQGEPRLSARQPEGP
jgi:glyoxylase-like metal-dependent hydrolase (beta-lactamase superfamily II)